MWGGEESVEVGRGGGGGGGGGVYIVPALTLTNHNF